MRSTALGGLIGKRRARRRNRNPWLVVAKLVGVGVAAFGIVAICNHAEATRPAAPRRPRRRFLVVLTFLAKRTTFGRHVYAVGGNAEAARRAGINVARDSHPRLHDLERDGRDRRHHPRRHACNSVDLKFGGGTLLLNSIAAAVIGGVSLFGGRGEVAGALLGALVIATVSNGLDTAGYASGDRSTSSPGSSSCSP